MTRLSRLSASAAALALLTVLAACDDEQAGQAQGGGQQPPPQAVAIVTLEAEEIPVIDELPGRIAATRLAEVRPRVSGIITERSFTQGGMVEEGDLLYRIDPDQFRVQVDRARAALEQTEAARKRAEQEATRQEELRARNVVSAQTYDDAAAELAQTTAAVAVARAELAAAELDLQYSEVRAPISGRIGRALITEGALVAAANPQTLATIQQLDPVYADFTQSSGELLTLRRDFEAGRLSRTDSGDAEVRLMFDDGSEYETPGRLLFSESTVDETTGQITLRAEFPNPEGDLLPGMYVRVSIQQGVEPEGLAVPVQAVQRDMNGDAVLWVVGEDNAVAAEPVELDRIIDGRWVIKSGAEAGQRVIVEGFQKTGPGATVTPEPWSRDQAPGQEG